MTRRAGEVHRLDDILDHRDQHFALAVAHHPDVLRAVRKDFLDRAEAAAVGQKNLASDRFVIVELARLRGRDVLVREHHDRALERLGRIDVGDTFERDSPRRRVERRHRGDAKLARFAAALQEDALDLVERVGVGIVGAESQRALEPVGAGYAADAKHRCWRDSYHRAGAARAITCLQ